MVDIELPAMGEGVTGATISKWLVKPGDQVEEEDPVVEVATDKVDSEVIAPADGVIENLFFNEGDEVSVGEALANMKAGGAVPEESEKEGEEPRIPTKEVQTETKATKEEKPEEGAPGIPAQTPGGKYLSPLVRSIAEKEGLTVKQLEAIKGTGLHGRITKDDLFVYLSAEHPKAKETAQQAAPKSRPQAEAQPQTQARPREATSGQAPETPQAPEEALQGATNYEVVKMDRMRRLIADHMVTSKRNAPHVTSFIEVDVTDLVEWRHKMKNDFQQKYGEKLTFTPIFIDAAVKALKDYPMVNVSLSGDEIYVKKDINIGMAAALPSGNLIVPVIKNAETQNLLGLAKSVNDLAARARNNKLKPNEIKGGTFTLTNLGNFGSMTGTPVINQPEAAILALGAITKKPAVIETPKGDTVGIRQIMVLSLSYDHRIVDGALGGMFLKRVADNLEQFDTSQTV